MSYNTYDQNSITAQNGDTFRSTAHGYKMEFRGLRPRTRHKMYLDDVDYTWACKGFGQKLGEDVMSDENGAVKLIVYYEIPLTGAAAFENLQQATYSSGVSVGQQNSRAENKVYVQYKTWNLKSADGLSSAMFQVHFHIVMTNTDYNRIEQHD